MTGGSLLFASHEWHEVKINFRTLSVRKKDEKPDRAKWLRKFEGEEGEARLLKHLAEVYSKKFLEQGNERAVEELLERFSSWFNKQNGRRGDLWMDRLKSVLVDGETALSAHLDLYPVRAGMVDPMSYEWSGDGEAVGGTPALPVVGGGLDCGLSKRSGEGTTVPLLLMFGSESCYSVRLP